MEAKNAKRNYEIKVASESKNNPKAFYQIYKSKVKDSLGPLKKLSGEIADGDLEMCSIFNDQFLSVFTKENTNQIPEINLVLNGSADELINTVEVSRVIQVIL